MNRRNDRFSAALTGFVFACLSLSTPAFSDVIGYWRFEGDLTDSSGNGRTLTADGGSSTASIPGSGAGSDFSNPIPKTGAANTGMTTDLIGGASDDGYYRNDEAAFFVTQFTIEAYINMDAAAFLTIASQYGEASSNQRAWRFVTSLSASDRVLNMGISEDGLSSGGWSALSSLIVAEDTDYYAAAVVSIDPAGLDSKATYYLKDLTNGGALQTETVAFAGGAGSLNTIYDSTAPFVVGGSWAASAQQLNNEWDGRIDEVRWSNTTLTQNDLLITAVPEPASLGLILLGAMLLRLRLRRTFGLAA